MLGLLTEKLRRLRRNFQNGACAGWVGTERVLSLCAVGAGGRLSGASSLTCALQYNR